MIKEITLGLLISVTNIAFVNTAQADDIEHITVTGTQAYRSYYSALGVYYVYGSAYNNLYAQEKWNREYEKLTKYAHCVSAAATSKGDCVAQAQGEIEDLHEICVAGATTVGMVWGTYFTPFVGGPVYWTLDSLCVAAKRNALNNVDSFCDEAVEDYKAECSFKYYGA